MAVPETAFLRHLSHSLLGRMKLLFFEEICGCPATIPAAAQVRSFLLDACTRNLAEAQLLAPLLNQTTFSVTRYADLPPAAPLTPSLETLENEPLVGPFFLELVDCPLPLSQTAGAFVQCEEMAIGGYVYTITLLSEAEFPTVVRAEVRAFGAEPEPVFSLLGNAGFERVSLSDYAANPSAAFLARIVNFVAKNHPRVFLPIGKAGDVLMTDRRLYPPFDQRYSRRVQDVVRAQQSCAEVEVALSQIRPHDIDFALSLPTDVVDETIDAIQSRPAPPLLLYWQDDHFVMSDCYPVYLALRKLDRERVLAVTMGPFPPDQARVICSGGAELLPPVQVSHRGPTRELPPDVKAFMLDVQLREAERSAGSSELYSACIGLAALLQRPNVQERDVHVFLMQHPVALVPHGIAADAEVRLGDKYRVDVLVQHDLNDRRITLVELESPRAKLFTKYGRLRAEATHAMQQVEDWFRWWRENPSLVPNFVDPTTPLAGLVVMGRSNKFSDDDRRRLLSLNAARSIQLITYDDLVARLRATIANLEGR